MRVAGSVRERESDGGLGGPIGAARLVVHRPGTRDRTVEVGDDGRYLVDLDPGAWTGEVTADGFDVAQTRFLVRDTGTDRPMTVNYFLERPSASEGGIVGHVFSRRRRPFRTIGDPVGGAAVSAVQRGGRPVRAITDPDGAFTLAVPPGRWIVLVRATGHEPARRTVVVRSSRVVHNVFLHPVALSPGPRAETCVFTPSTRPVAKRAELVLPGLGLREVDYQLVDGDVVLEGTVTLGREADLLREARDLAAADPDDEDVTDSRGNIGVVRQALVAQTSRRKLWDGGVVPFAMRNLNTTLRGRVQQAIDLLEANSNVRFVPADESFGSRVVFAFSSDPNASSSPLGRQGGDQVVRLNEFFDVGGIIHEILHSLGVLHEQNRPDRDAFVTILTDNILQDRRDQFTRAVSGVSTHGAYDHTSIMHYGAFAFGKEDDTGATLQTIDPVSSTIADADLGSARGASPFLSAGDIAGLASLYPTRLGFEGGQLWGDGNWATDIAFGDIDGDGRDEIIVTRRAGGNNRWNAHNDGLAEYLPRGGGGANWGDGTYATCVATGDLDGDGKDEVVIGRRSGTNMRFEVLRYDGGSSWVQLTSGGSGWGDGAWVTDVAVARDGDGTWLVGVARHHGSNARAFVYRWVTATNSLDLLTTFGSNWGSSAYATGIAFGDVDGDGRLEVVVTRRADDNGRWFVHDDMAAGFVEVFAGGVNWGSGNWATACATGDVDGDGRAEIAIARKSNSNDRYFVHDDMQRAFAPLASGGASWGTGNYATGIDLGRTTATSGPDLSLAVCRRADQNLRYRIEDITP